MQQRAPGSPQRGIAWMLLTMVLFVSQDTVSKILLQSYPTIQVGWARFFVQMVLVAVLLAPHLRVVVRTQRLGMQLGRSALLIGVTFLMFVSLQLMPLADVAAVMFLTPILATALSVPLLGEHVGIRRALGIAVGFCGAVLIVGPSGETLQWAALVPLGAATLNALYQLATRVLRTTESTNTTIFYTAVVGTVVCTAAVPPYWVAPDLTGWLLMLALGAIGTVSHFALIRAYTLAGAATLAPFAYTTILWATLFGYVLFDEVPTPLTLAGAALIIASGLYIVYRERQLNKLR